MLDSYGHEAPSDLVLVHGAGENNFLWRGTTGFLSGDGRAVAVNLPGHPEGDITCHSVAEYAEAVRVFIKEAGMVRPAVGGHSMGGAVALTLAVEHPDSVGALCLFSTGAKLGVLPEILEGLESEPLAAIERAVTPLSYYRIDLELARQARSALSLANPQVFLNDYLACRAFDLRGRLGQIRSKSLVVCGEGDRLTPPKWSHYLGSHIPDSSVYFVREAGHMVPLEKPALCGGILQSFLSSLNP